MDTKSYLSVWAGSFGALIRVPFDGEKKKIGVSWMTLSRLICSLLRWKGVSQTEKVKVHRFINPDHLRGDAWEHIKKGLEEAFNGDSRKFPGFHLFDWNGVGITVIRMLNRPQSGETSCRK